MLETFGQGYQDDIYIEGGLWGYDYGHAGPKTWTGLTIKFEYDDPVDPKTSLLSITSGTLTRDQFAGYVKAIWLKDQSTSLNNDRVFVFAPDSDQPNDQTKISVLGAVENETKSDFTAQVVPPAGGGFRIKSNRALLRDVKLINTRGIGYLLGGDDFQLIDSSSRDVIVDSGGGVRFFAGTGIRARGLHIESSDDCFQFNPNDSPDGIVPGDTIARASIVDSAGLTNQGALVAFINGNGRAYAVKDSLTRLSDSYIRNIRGQTGGSDRHGGVAIKMYCANSSYPMTNVWAEDIYARQSDTTPPDTLRAGVMIVTGRPAEGGRPGSGVLNSGVRNLVVENRSGPLVAIGPADNPPANFSKAVDFTVEQARGVGAGTQAGLPLIGAPYADRLVLRDVSGDLAGTGRALEICVPLTYVSGGFPQTIVAGLIGELVVDGCATAGAALPATDSGKRQGIWQFGNITKASVRRLATTVATGAPAVGGIELVTTAQPGATFCRFAEVDFTNIANTYEIATWQTQVSNRIVDSIGFDDRSETVTLATGVASVTPVRFAPTIALSATGNVLTSMTAPGVPAPRCTLLVPSGVTIKNGSGAGSFSMGVDLVGGASTNFTNITFQWLPSGNRWREVARTA